MKIRNSALFLLLVFAYADLFGQYPISGLGTQNYVAKFTGQSAIGNSIIYDNGKVGIGTTSPSSTFHVTASLVNNPVVTIANTNTTANSFAYGLKVIGSNATNNYGQAASYASYVQGGNATWFGAYDVTSYGQYIQGGSTSGMGSYSFGLYVVPGGASTGGKSYAACFMGNVLINKSWQTNSAYKLDVDGKVRANEVVVNTNGSDFVFSDDYTLLSLGELERYVTKEKHLPDIPSASEMQNEGVGVGALQTKLLQKVEELTLYVIAQDKRIEKLEKENAELKNKQ